MKQLNTLTLNELLQHEPTEIRDWWATINSMLIRLSKDFNWLGFAEVAAFKANSESSLLWAEIAISVYERLALDANNKDIKERYMISSMFVRVNMIKEFGSVLNHSILDVNKIISWFSTDLGVSLEEVEKRVKEKIDWLSCDIAEIRELRKIKNRLAVISVLINSEEYDVGLEIKHWLSLKQRLP